jgi:cation-transporting ATPase 13A1
VVQHTEERGALLRTPDGGCLAFVLRTGFGTEQARLRICMQRH